MLLALTAVAACGMHRAAAGEPASGPLRLNPANPRYFTDGTGKAVYLTGSHTWTNFKDMGHSDPPPAFDYRRLPRLPRARITTTSSACGPGSLTQFELPVAA